MFRVFSHEIRGEHFRSLVDDVPICESFESRSFENKCQLQLFLKFKTRGEAASAND